MSSKIKPPKGSPAIPDGWEYKGVAWQAAKPTKYGCWRPGEPSWGCLDITPQMTAARSDYHYIAPISAKGAAYLKPRRESLTARIATAIQTGQNKPAMDTAREVMRLVDNHQRAKRRKEGK